MEKIEDNKYLNEALITNNKELLICILRDHGSFSFYSEKFSLKEFQFINEVLMKKLYTFNSLQCKNSHQKEAILVKFKFSQRLLLHLRENYFLLFYNFLLTIRFLITNQKFSEAYSALYTIMNNFLNNKDNRTDLSLNFLRARAFYYLSLVAEKENQAKSIISILQAGYRNAKSINDDISIVTIVNCILRYYVVNNAYEQAWSFVNKTRYIYGISKYQDIRYNYYKAKVLSVYRKYSEALVCLNEAICDLKASKNNGYSQLRTTKNQNSEHTIKDQGQFREQIKLHNHKATKKKYQIENNNKRQKLGFDHCLTKLLILINLHIGVVVTFNNDCNCDCNCLNNHKCDKDKDYAAYINLQKSVQSGNLKEFNFYINKYDKVFEKDTNYNLVKNLRIEVIKVGLYKINIAYSTISISDINQILGIDDEKSCETILMNAIYRKYFHARINYDKKTVTLNNIPKGN